MNVDTTKPNASSFADSVPKNPYIYNGSLSNSESAEASILPPNPQLTSLNINNGISSNAYPSIQSPTSSSPSQSHHHQYDNITYSFSTGNNTLPPVPSTAETYANPANQAHHHTSKDNTILSDSNPITSVSSMNLPKNSSNQIVDDDEDHWGPKGIITSVAPSTNTTFSNNADPTTIAPSLPTAAQPASVVTLPAASHPPPSKLMRFLRTLFPCCVPDHNTSSSRHHSGKNNDSVYSSLTSTSNNTQSHTGVNTAYEMVVASRKPAGVDAHATLSTAPASTVSPSSAPAVNVNGSGRASPVVLKTSVLTNHAPNPAIVSSTAHSTGVVSNSSNNNRLKLGIQVIVMFWDSQSHLFFPSYLGIGKEVASSFPISIRYWQKMSCFRSRRNSCS